jgi:hypothetical protein
MTDPHDQQQDQQKTDQTDKPRWQDPGDDDISLRHEAPENILNKMVRRDD